MSDRHEQAGAHAEARTQTWTDPHSEYADGYVSGHMAGVEWADANPQPRTITADEFEKAVRVLRSSNDGGTMESWGAQAQELLRAAGIEVTDDAD